MAIKFPGKLPPAPEWKPEIYDPNKPPTARPSSRDKFYGDIQVGTSVDGINRGPRVAPVLKVASPPLPAHDPIRALKGDIGNDVPIRASAAVVPTSTPFRSAPAAPAPAGYKPFRVK